MFCFSFDKAQWQCSTIFSIIPSQFNTCNLNWAFRIAIVSLFYSCVFYVAFSHTHTKTPLYSRSMVFSDVINDFGASLLCISNETFFICVCVLLLLGCCFVCGSFCAYVAQWNRTNGTFICFVLPNESYFALHPVRSINACIAMHLFGRTHTHTPSTDFLLDATK